MEAPIGNGWVETPPIRLREWRSKNRSTDGQQADDPITRQAPERLYCSRCGHEITRGDARISMGGRHGHIFTNPAGVTFKLGCFADAPGVVHQGPAIRDHSWFPGYAWRIALCGQCGQHLGWGFVGEGDPPGFHGLILPRLTSRNET